MKRSIWEYLRDGLVITGGLYLATMPSYFSETSSLQASAKNQVTEQHPLSKKLANRWTDRNVDILRSGEIWAIARKMAN